MPDSDVTEINSEIEVLDEVVRRVAERMPFRVGLEADMGGTFVQQIMLGRRGDTDDPPDRATIDPGAGEVWWLDVEGGRESIESPFTRDADPQIVAEWIATVAREAGSPAATGGPAVASGSGAAVGLNARLDSILDQPTRTDSLLPPSRQERGPSL